MAVKRRSARLQKTPTKSPSPGPNESALDASTPTTKPLPSLPEQDDNQMEVTEVQQVQHLEHPKLQQWTKTQETPNKNTMKPVSHLPQPATTPKSTLKSFFSRAGYIERTPQNKTPIRPSHQDMHPQHHHRSTAKPREEARWLGLFSQNSQTVPARGGNKSVVTNDTPTKSTGTLPQSLFASDFRFKMKQPSLELSPEAKKLMEETREEAAKVRAQMLATNDEFSGLADDVASITGALSGRKFAQPKGKAGRFSDVHMEQFKKMDSIANHPSAFRADPNRFKPVESAKKSLKRSPSKADLDGDESLRTPKRSGIPAAGSALPRPKSTIKLVSDEKRDSTAVAQTANKRAKNTADQDATTKRSIQQNKVLPATPKGHLPRPTAMSRLTSLATPTKASMARSQSVKSLKSGLPTLTRSPSKGVISSFVKSPTMQALSPLRATASIRDGVRQISDSIKGKTGIKGILRTPQRQFSNDPIKVAAGTHVATPQPSDQLYPTLPVTAPVVKIKHVEFTASTVARADKAQSSSPIISVVATDDSESTDEATEQPSELPSIASVLASPRVNTSRRSTISDLPIPGSFTFRSERQVSFGPATSGTIRRVRKSDASEVVQEAGKKRKLDVAEEVSGGDKENDEPADEDENRRSAKKARVSVAPKLPPSMKTPNRFARNSRAPKRMSGLSTSRLNFLSTPKRRNP